MHAPILRYQIALILSSYVLIILRVFKTYRILLQGNQVHTYTRVEPRARHRKHWLVSCRGSVRCRNTAGAKRAASKHGSCETFQSDRHACIRHGSCAPKAARLVTAVRVGAVWPTCGTSCGASRRGTQPGLRSSMRRSRPGLRSYTSGATGCGQARSTASDLVCHPRPRARA